MLPIALLSLLSGASLAPTQLPSTPVPAPALADARGVEPAWQADLDAALTASARDGRPVVVVFSAVWCTACRRFRERTLGSGELAGALEEHHWVKVDVDRQPSLAEEYDVDATPQVVVLDADGKVLGEARGALKPGPFLAFLRAAGNADRARPSAGHDADFGSLVRSPRGFRGRGVCFSHVGYGPLDLPSQSPNQILRAGLRPRTPSTLGQGQWELYVGETFANVFAYEEDNFRLDYLTLNSTLSVGYGVSDSVAVEVSLRNLSRFHSFLDPVTDAFHDLFGLGDSGRDDFPGGDNVIDFEPGPDGYSLTDDTHGSESTDLGFAVLHNLTCGTEVLPALSYAVHAQYHLGGRADLEGGSPWSYGLSAAASRRLGDDWYVYLGVDHTWHGLDEARGLPLVDEQWGGLLAVEWRYAPECAWVLQYLTNQGVAETRDPFDDPTHELNLGWKYELATGTVLEVGLIENIIEVDNSPDFGLHFGLRRRF